MYHLTLSENDTLDDLGLLRTGYRDPRVSRLSPEERELLLRLYLAGAQAGLCRSKLKKSELPLVDTLELLQMLTWERDKRGKPSQLVFTWRGEDTAKLLVRLAKLPKPVPEPLALEASP